METSLFDESAVERFDVDPTAKADAIRFGRQFLAETSVRPEEVTCKAWPPDGVEVVLSNADRALRLFFVGSGRFVFGKRAGASPERQGEGEMSLDEAFLAYRKELYDWLDGPDGAAVE